ncbi:hypothetical protein PILCRDRAFT_74055 [Piloderma croceum F 1598]|uniref:CTLH domain-containing protein n=1 Tax=Piloderma croceum (strain F 1598) TaxID=765440 RepID=A0A0C3FIS3_PILCF|nr:hypothetical protein PILCRDRAFT_74055 [Piloderma croceum F 1598]
MRIPESDQESAHSVSLDSAPQAGPSSLGLDGPGPSNGHTNGNGFTLPSTNGFTNGAGVVGNGVQKHGKSVAKVSLLGTALYADGSYVDREEFVRLVIQSLRDVGYIESAATLEAESGYTMEAPEVSQFRQYILEASWSDAEDALTRLGVTDSDGLWVCYHLCIGSVPYVFRYQEAKFFIGQQKYLELLEAGKTTLALQVLRNELAPLNVAQDQLHFLSGLMMCSDPTDLRQRAEWDGASGTSRRELLTVLQRYVPASIMIPQRRFSTLLQQAQSHQRQQCVYHNSPLDSKAFSLYEDHQCDKDVFPGTTTAILDVHVNEVWNIEWSHDGSYLASASKDKTAIIWRIDDPSIRDYTAKFVLRDHSFPVGCLAWSLDDSILLTGADNEIRMWNTKTGVCTLVLDSQHGHQETVAALSWLPDGSGFISGGLDRRIILWDAEGNFKDSWGETAIRVTDLAITPDLTRVVAVGIHYLYDLATKQTELSFPLEGELSSVKISRDSRYALVNRTQNEIYLYDLHSGRLARKFAGQRQGKHVIRSCFGGIDGNFVVSGSEDGNVYVWQCDTGILLETLPGHGEGSVNSVAWNPTNERMFATCSDDHTIRIWEAPLRESGSRVTNRSSSNGKGKTRQQSNGDGVDFDSAFGAWVDG